MLIVVTGGSSDARPKDGAVRQFCAGAPDLCVFRCTGSRLQCHMEGDWICESRRGRLIVAEGDEVGGNVSTYEQDYSLCVYNVGERYRTIWPDPEEIFVPEWPGNDSDALCMMCKRSGDRCLRHAQSRASVCESDLETYVRGVCKDSMKRHGWPKNRHGRDIGGSQARVCKQVLKLPKKLEEVDPYWSKEMKRCREAAITNCVEEQAVDHPERTWENSVRLEISDVFGGRHKGTVTWGGSRGYRRACSIAGNMAASQCTSRKSACYVAAQPSGACDEYEDGQ